MSVFAKTHFALLPVPAMIASSVYSYATTPLLVGPQGTRAILLPPANGFVIQFASAVDSFRMFVGTNRTSGFPTPTSYDFNAAGRAGQLILGAENYSGANYIYFYFTSSQPVTVTFSVLAKGWYFNTFSRVFQ